MVIIEGFAGCKKQAASLYTHANRYNALQSTDNEHSDALDQDGFIIPQSQTGQQLL